MEGERGWWWVFGGREQRAEGVGGGGGGVSVSCRPSGKLSAWAQWPRHPGTSSERAAFTVNTKNPNNRLELSFRFRFRLTFEGAAMRAAIKTQERVRVTISIFQISL